MKNINFHHATAFVSSTFSDMLYERNLIMYNVLPRVKQWAFKRGVIFDIIDLRWGINDQQAKDLHHTINICLKKVQESDPIFLCFLGERYGWIPNEQDFNQKMFETNIQDFKNLSATELEILQATHATFYESSPKSCVFFFRNPLNFSEVPDHIKDIYVEKEALEPLQKLKERIKKEYDVIEYDAEFMNEGADYALHNFSVGDSRLEDSIFERLINILSEKYHLDNVNATVFEDELIRQQHHLKQLSLLPKIVEHHDKLKEIIEQTQDFTSAFIGIPTGSALYSQIAQIIMEQQSIGLQVMYRFIGIDRRVKTANDVVTSLAHELSGDSDYHDNLFSSLSFLREKLETMDKQVLLFVAGLKPAELMDYILVLRGLKFTKIIYILETDENEELPYYLNYTQNTFKILAEYLFAKKAKSLTDIQLNRIVSLANSDYAQLKVMVTYLCTFATYETLNQMIQEISNLDKLKLTRLYLKRLAAVQNEHHTSGVMENILELLCASPLPLSKNDIVDAIYLSRSKEERCATDDIRKEVDFSLAFAQDYIEEHNGRFTITDETVKTVMLFDKIEGTSERPLFIPKLCSLMLALRTVYVARLYSKDQICNEDAENLCEIIKDFSSPDFRSIFYHTVIKDMKTFFKLASALSKRALVDLFKTLSLQSMGYDVESYFSKEIKRVMEVEENPIGQTQSVLREKLFSVSRSTQPENIFLSYYAVAIGIGDGDLSSYERFVTFINGNLFTDAQKLNYHILHLPANWNITSGNTTCYTIFDVDAQSYITYCCHCENGFAIICDVLTAEEKKAYALARNVGEVVATFYQNHTIHIIYENGVITVINTNTNMVNTYRFAKEDTHITWFLHDYPKEYQVAVSNNNTIEIYHKLRKVGYISLQEGLEALSVHVLSYQDDLPKKLVFIAKNEVGNYFCCLFDFQENKTTYTRSFANHEIIGILQDEKTRDIYVETNHGFSFVLRYNGGEDLVVDLDIEQLYCADDSLKIVQYKENIFCNDELIVRNAHAICRFSSRKMIGFITTDNTLYIFDNGY